MCLGRGHSQDWINVVIPLNPSIWDICLTEHQWKTEVLSKCVCMFVHEWTGQSIRKYLIQGACGELRAANRHWQWTSNTVTYWYPSTHPGSLSHWHTRVRTQPCNNGHPQINGQRDVIWQAIESSTVLMRPAASGDWLEEVYQYVSITTVQQQKLAVL